MVLGSQAEAHSRVARDPLKDSRSGQVFWLMVHPTPRAFPSVEPDSGVSGFRPH
jgi:hypothetical protein